MDKKNIITELIQASDSGDFERWSYPSFDDSDADSVFSMQDESQKPEAAEEELSAAEEVEIEEVQPLTLEEVEAIRQDAYNEGFLAGEKDGLHSGQVKAQKEAKAALQPRLQALEKIMQQLFEPIASQDQQLEQAMLELVQLISREVIKRELVLDSTRIGQVVRESLGLLPLEGAQVRIYLHPQDFAQIKELRERHEENWRIIEDDSLLPGGCRIEAAQTRVDASMETRIEQLAKQLLEQQRSLQAEPVAANDIQEFDLQAAVIADAEPLEPVADAAQTGANPEKEPNSEPQIESQAEESPPGVSQ